MELSNGRFLGKKSLEGKDWVFSITENNEWNDCLLRESKTGKNGKPYYEYTLFLSGTNGVLPGDFKMSGLFERDLGKIKEKLGNNSNNWYGKLIEVKVVKDKEFQNWNIEVV